MSYISIYDKEFEETISLKKSYEMMYEFLSAIHERGEIQTGDLLGFVGLMKDGGSSDPAQLYDYLNAFQKIKST